VDTVRADNPLIKLVSADGRERAACSFPFFLAQSHNIYRNLFNEIFKKLKHSKNRRSEMISEQYQEIVDTALLKGIVEADCMECGMSIECEIDAKTAWCDVCEKTVRVKNPLIELGFL
jgi:hypothetical protein